MRFAKTLCETILGRRIAKPLRNSEKALLSDTLRRRLCRALCEGALQRRRRCAECSAKPLCGGTLGKRIKAFCEGAPERRFARAFDAFFAKALAKTLCLGVAQKFSAEARRKAALQRRVCEGVFRRRRRFPKALCENVPGRRSA